MNINDIPLEIREKVKRGVVIPAVPLALKADRTFDTKYQAALLKYYIDAGVGGIAIGVHSTEWEIRDPQFNLFEPILSLTSKTIDEYCEKKKRKILKIAGILGKTEQALREAEFAKENGYHAGLLCLSAFAQNDIDTMTNHCEKVAKIMPIFGFYLSSSAGGVVLPYSFWRRFVEIKNVLGIKIAPFNRYRTFDVVRAVCDADRENDIALYTGNDDNIVCDLLTEYKIKTEHAEKKVRIVGGLLGHWGVWTKKAVELLDEIHTITENNLPIPPEMLVRAQEVTDANAAFFDAANGHAGSRPGIREVLRRQGLLRGTWCLNLSRVPSPGQLEEIDRVFRSYPHLSDHEFIKKNLTHWLNE
jgi:hypothetical protein